MTKRVFKRVFTEDLKTETRKESHAVYEDLSKTTQHTNLELIMANSKGVLLRSRYCRLVFTEHKETYKHRYGRA